MNKKILITFVVLALAVSALALAPQSGKFGQKEAQLRDTDTWIDANLLLMFVTNKGSFAYDQGGTLGKNDGLYFPFTGIENIEDKSQTSTSIFAAGIWVGAVDSATGDTLVTVAEYSDDYFPGPMTGGTFTAGADNAPRYHVYKLYSDSLEDNPNSDYNNWPVGDGAPVDSNGNPAMLGDQMLWSVYNDANPAPHINNASSGTGLGVEIRQTTFAYAREGALANIIFLKFQIYNKGNLNLKDMFVSLWADPDLGDAGDDFVGCDTLLSLGFCYNDGAPDASYGDAPPAVGFDFFQGPLVFTGNPADTAIMWNFTKFAGYQNMPMTSFNKYINGTDPVDKTWTYQYMNGLDASNGGAPNPNGTKFAVPGDPVAGTGDLDVNSSDRRYLLTTGPFNFAPGDSTEVVAAIVVGQGSDQLNSVTQLKQLDEFSQTVYNRSFILPDPPARPVVDVAELDEELVLKWGTESEDDPGDYPFEGYAVMQGVSASGPWTDTLGWFDIQNGVEAVIDSFFNTITHDFFPRIVKPGKDKGLQRYWRATTDKVNGGPMINYTDYYFKVEAYSFDLSAVKGERTLTSATIVRAMPQPPRVGTDYNQVYSDALGVSHDSGVSDGVITPIVVDPSALTGDNYRIDFFIDTILAVDTIITTIILFPPPPDTVVDTIWDTLYIGIVWNLINTTTGDTLIEHWVNQGNNEDFPVVDGILLKVQGPAAGIKSFEVVANGTGTLATPVGGAFDFQNFPSIRPDATQQVGGGLWGIHTFDNGGSCGGGTYGSYEDWVSRVLRNDNADRMSIFDFEMRFTGDTNSSGVYDSSLGGGSIAIRAFQDEAPSWVPVEIWRIGIGTPNDASDDIRMVPWHLDFDDNFAFNLESWGCLGTEDTTIDTTVFPPDTTITLLYAAGGEHSASGADNDPYTDAIYWFFPDTANDDPGESGYLNKAAQILGGTYDFGDAEVFARTVLMSWNGHTLDSNGDVTNPPVFVQDLPEPGTVFRITTFKPNALNDIFTFNTSAAAPSVATSGSENELDNIKAVPNPYYLFSEKYDDNTTNRVLKFTNLPDKCTISIYNLAGQFITRIDKNDATTSAAEWKITNDFNVPVGSGIYIYVVDAPGFGQKIGKMAIFTEIEILGQY